MPLDSDHIVTVGYASKGTLHEQKGLPLLMCVIGLFGILIVCIFGDAVIFCWYVVPSTILFVGGSYVAARLLFVAVSPLRLWIRRQKNATLVFLAIGLVFSIWFSITSMASPSTGRVGTFGVLLMSFVGPMSLLVTIRAVVLILSHRRPLRI